MRRVLALLATTSVLAYLFFYVPIGRRTLSDHVTRIAGTREARELGRDVRGASARVVDRARGEIAQGLEAVTRPPVGPPTVDASATVTSSDVVDATSGGRRRVVAGERGHARGRGGRGEAASPRR